MTTRLLLTTYLLATIACDSSRPEQNQTPAVNPSPDSSLIRSANIPFDTKELRHADFVMQIPAAARIDSAGGNFPAADVLARDTSFCPNGCDIAVQVHNGVSASLSSFVDSIAKPESQSREALQYAPSIIDSLQVDGRQARWVKYWCGDCEWHALFVAGDGRIAEIGFNLDARDRTATRTKVLHALASTFSWVSQ